MTKCVNCHYFDNPVSRGRESKSCFDLGELPGNTACDNYKPTSTVTGPESLLAKSPHFELNYNNVFMEIITEIFEIQKSADIVVHSVSAQLQQQGYTVEFDPKFFLSSVSKILEVIMVHRLTLGLGVGNYNPEIMSWVLSDKFSRKDLSSATVQNLQANRGQADVLGDIQNTLREVSEKLRATEDKSGKVNK